MPPAPFELGLGWLRALANVRMLTLEVVPNLHQLTMTGTNLFVIAEDELTLVDTGLPGSVTRTKAFIEHLGRSIDEVSTIIITHNHFDHTGGVPDLLRLTKAKIAAHRAGLGDASTGPPYPRGVRRLLRLPLLYPLRRRFVLDSSDVDIKLEGGEVLEPLGGLQVIHTPGHTPGSISLYSPRHRLLFVGDALQKRRKGLRPPAKMVSTDLEQAIASVRKMTELDVETLCLGHGMPVADGARARLLALLEHADVSRRQRGDNPSS